MCAVHGAHGAPALAVPALAAPARCRRLASDPLAYTLPRPPRPPPARQTYALDTKTLAIIEVAVFAFLEAKRYESYKKVGEGGALGIAPFDPMGMRTDEMRLKEVKNARLAMLAFVGFCSQAAVRGKGPIECLTDHIADPWHNNIFTSSVGPESTVAVAALAIWPMIIEATKRWAGGPAGSPLGGGLCCALLAGRGL
jgi:hypothetical protein